jgi:hypothetical protein
MGRRGRPPYDTTTRTSVEFRPRLPPRLFTPAFPSTPAAGRSTAHRSVKDAVAGGIAAMIAEHRTAIGSFGEDTRKDTLERADERVKQVRHKLAACAEYLSDERGKLERELADAARELRAKVEKLTVAPVLDAAVP